jgi:hypothetical protein
MAETGRAGLPILAFAGLAVIVVGVLLYLAVGRRSEPPRPTQPPATAVQSEPGADEEDVGSPARTPAGAEAASPNLVNPSAIAGDLERALRRQRLWSSVEVAGSLVEVRSGSCRDADMLPMIEAAGNAMRNAGLTRVRCVEQSGAVVFERAL